MMKLLKEIRRQEGGQALVLALLLMLVGSLIIAPVLGYMGTGVRTGIVYEGKLDELYAADAGVEDAISKIVTDYAPVLDLDENDPPFTYSFTGAQQMNGLTVDVTISRLSLMQGLLGEDEFNLGQPHEGWVSFSEPGSTRNEGEGWVEYTCHVSFHYDGVGNRTLTGLGAFFSPIPGDESVIEGPYDWLGTETGVMEFTFLEADSPFMKMVPGGFAFIWKWQQNPDRGPRFDGSDPDGAFDFSFKVYNLDWAYSIYFIWSTFKEQDISYVTDAPGLGKWMITAAAGETTTRSAILENAGDVNVLTWEIDPLH